MVHDLNCSHPLASQAGNVSVSEIFSLLMKEEQQEFVLKVPALIFMIIYVCLGIPGNFLVIIIYYFRFRASTTKTFIVSLSMFDLISCFLGIPFEMVDLRYDLELDVPVVCKTLRFIITFCACGSTLILLSVAADRFRRICQPFKRQMSIKQSKIVLGSMTLVSFVISVPALVLYGRKTKDYRGVTTVDCTIDDRWAKTSFANGYQFILGLLWVSSILVLCVMYGVIIYKIRKQEIRRLNLTSNSMASVHASRFYGRSSSNPTHPNMLVRKGSSASNPTDFRSSPANNRARFQQQQQPQQQQQNNSENTLERSNSNPEEKVQAEDGGKGLGSSRQQNSLNRLFSRDVNPIYEEEDEAHNVKSPTVHISDKDENENDNENDDSTLSNSLEFIQEEIVEDGDTIILVTMQEDSPPLSRTDCEYPVSLRAIKTGDHDLSKRLSRSVPCLQGLSMTSDEIDCLDEDQGDDKAPIVERIKTKQKLKIKRSNSLPLSSENEEKRVYFVNQDFDEGECDTANNSSKRQRTENYYLSKKNDTMTSSSSLPKPINVKDDVMRLENDDIPETTRNSFETSNRLEVIAEGRSRYASDDRSLDCITSKSDQTNGSILTLNDSRVPQHRRRKISAYSMTRQASFTSTNNYSANDRSSKTNSYCSQNSTPGRIHKTSIASYTGKMSIASTTTRELKTSKIAVMMFYVTMGHVLSYLPHLAIQFHRALGPQDIARLLCNSVYFAFYHLLLRSIYLNNAINPIIYSYNNGQFRRYVGQLLKKPLSFCRKHTSSRPYTVDSAHSFTAD